VAWLEFSAGASTIHVWRFAGDEWEPLGEPIASSQQLFFPHLEIGSDGGVWIVYTRRGPVTDDFMVTYEAYVRRLNH
jgi:hypothetical protein